MARSIALVALCALLVLSSFAIAHHRPPAQAFACSPLAPIGLPDYPHACAVVRPHRDGTATLWLRRGGKTYEACQVTEPYGPPSAFCWSPLGRQR